LETVTHTSEAAVQRFPQSTWPRFILPGSITLVTLIGLSFMVDVHETVRVIGAANLVLLFLAALKVPLQAVFWTLRWQLIMRARAFPVAWKDTFVAVMVRSFFNNMTPGAGTGGEPFGAYYMARKTPLSFKQAMAGTASERMGQGVVFAGIVLFSVVLILPFLPLSSRLVQFLLIALSGFVGFVFLMLYFSVFQFKYGHFILRNLIRFITRIIPPLRSRWEVDRLDENLYAWHREFSAFMSTPRVIGWIALFTMVNWYLDLVQPYLIFRALNVEVPLWLILMNATIIRLSGTFGMIPGGAGLLEGINLGLYAGLSSIAEETLMAETILYRAMDAWILWLASGIITSAALAAIMKTEQKSG
jgi:uncharacterized protein (TIRG00374 family)